MPEQRDRHGELRQRYESVPYADGIFPQLHPVRLAPLARLHGHATVPNPATATILDLGCGAAGNLIEIAADLPDARCLGIDLAESHIGQGQRHIRARGLDNIELRQGDLCELDLGAVKFDYILAHGLLSWVPDGVKERIFQLCRGHLAADGVALISYNTYPGWSFRENLRQLLQLHLSAVSDPRQVRQGADDILGRLQRALGDAEHPHAPLLHHEIKHLQQSTTNALFHDDLDTVNDPCFFLQFIAWAAEHELDYVGDVDLSRGWPTLQSPQAREALLDGSLAPLMAEQYLDYVVNRRFRHSLLITQRSEPLRPSIDIFQGHYLRGRIKPQVILHAPGARLTFEGVTGHQITSDNGPAQALLATLAETTEWQPLEEILATAAKLEPAITADPETRPHIYRSLVECWAREMVDVASDIPRY
ncbi:methyltransferase regulatory domain-containing protein [Alkalilimnicola ehrlichii MLHE-1]|uniref:Methyltransferase type 12 n=1 Tax=Alkalilimnicola ehrlichii (strain ATCC BAA-1101 / DSM 17681 / MLHE-1) TaxID=187272 RepID=Q0A7D1_ALKEH|nr:class I SAM-dependent methyltransferase [Alkalilimnicola ehrlichii]ABI57256.1 Methyltransferase type 12 [Alkalilimnicola ehrlichii MLHE-1]